MSSSINPTQIDGNPIKELLFDELLPPGKDIVKACGIGKIVQRKVFTKDSSEFFIEFYNAVPRGEIVPLYPDFETDEVLDEGWQQVSVEYHYTNKDVTFEINGFYFREPVPIDIKVSLTQSSSGYVKDKVTINDRRTDEIDEETSLKQIMEAKLKSGGSKYAGPKDQYGTMLVARIFRLLNRYLKDWSVRHRFLEKD
jgi:hypothetical protein